MSSDSITVKDIATALKLSVAAVSTAVRDSHEISDIMKKQVNDYA